MKEALGLVEVIGLSTAVLIGDTMIKTANVSLLEIENTKGLGYMVVKVIGDVGAVNAAVNSGKMVAMENGKFISDKVIPRPSVYVEKWFCNPESESTPVKESATTITLDLEKENQEESEKSKDSVNKAKRKKNPTAIKSDNNNE